MFPGSQKLSAKSKMECRGSVGWGCRAALGRLVTGPREGRSAGTLVSRKHAAWFCNTECGSVRDKSHGTLPIFECPGMGALNAVTQAADCIHPGLGGLSLEARQEAGEPKREKWAGREGPTSRSSRVS